MAAPHSSGDPEPKGTPLRDHWQLRQLQAQCNKLCNWEHATFPGSQPVSLGRQQVQELMSKPYYACEKSDGVRYMLFIVYSPQAKKQHSFMVDRKFAMTQVNMTFPFVDEKTGEERLQSGTLLDGELVNDVVDGKIVQRYLVFDCVAVRGKNVMTCSLDRRLQYFYDHVMAPRLTSKLVDTSTEAFELDMKAMYRANDVGFIFSEIIPKLPHENDGIIFTPVNLPYYPGTCHQLLKWKPKELNTVDLEVGVEYRKKEPRFKVLACRQTVSEFFDWLTLHPEDKEKFIGDGKPSKIAGKIVECLYDENMQTFVPDDSCRDSWEQGTWKQGGWRLLRLREDKKLANDISTIGKVMKTVQDNLGRDELVSALYLPPDAQRGGSGKRGAGAMGDEQREAQRQRREDGEV